MNATDLEKEQYIAPQLTMVDLFVRSMILSISGEGMEGDTMDMENGNTYDW